MSAIIKGDNTITWGVGTIYSLGYIQKVTDLETGEEVEIADNNGETVAAVLFNARDELSVEVILKSTDVIPARGSDVTVAGKAKCTVLERERAWENKGALKLNMKLKRYAFNRISDD